MEASLAISNELLKFRFEAFLYIYILYKIHYRESNDSTCLILARTVVVASSLLPPFATTSNYEEQKNKKKNKKKKKVRTDAP